MQALSAKLTRLFARYSYLIIIYAIFIYSSFYIEYTDEWDNILGGKLISEGTPLYKAYFSHHFPLPYYVSALIHLFTGVNFILFRIIYASLLFGVVAFLYLKYRTANNNRILQIFFLLWALFSPAAWMHLLLAENLVAYCILSIFFIVLCGAQPYSARALSAIGFLASCIALSSAGYAYLAVVFYLYLGFLIVSQSLYKSTKKLVVIALVSVAPLLLFALTLTISQSWEDFFWQNFYFNINYYFPFTNRYPTNPLLLFQQLLLNAWYGFILGLESFSIYTPTSIYTFFFMLCFVAIAYAVKRGRYSLAILFLFSLIFSLSRFAHNFELGNSRNVPFYSVALVSFLWVNLDIQLRSPSFFKFWKTSALCLAPIIFVLLTGQFVAGVGSSYLNGRNIITAKSRISDILNRLCINEDNTWIGPFDFKTYYTLSCHSATRYYFYLQWHASSPQINTELIEALQERRPKIIYFNREAGAWLQAKKYAPELMSFLRKSYERVSTPIDSNFYILRTYSHREILRRQLKELLKSPIYH